ncbi:hypothetical protein, partial [Rhizobium subbaraonis]|uniref:hypothetical protein n=1 Tax=Rhizobium subbaraonis TaxID=908946 RepID=UPI001AED0323
LLTCFVLGRRNRLTNEGGGAAGDRRTRSKVLLGDAGTEAESFGGCFALLALDETGFDPVSSLTIEYREERETWAAECRGRSRDGLSLKETLAVTFIKRQHFVFEAFGPYETSVSSRRFRT